MAETRTARESVVRHPDDVDVSNMALELGEAGAGGRRRRSASFALASELEAIVSAAEAQAMVAADAFELAPPLAEGRRRRAVAASTPIEIEVPLAPGEDAVLLVESEGVYAWQLPDQAVPPPSGRRRRRGDGNSARFRLPLPAAAPPPEMQRRGWLGDRLVGAIVEPIRAVVLKFIAGKVIDVATGKLDEKLEPGLVHIVDGTVQEWQAGRPIVSARPLQDGRSPRILLLIHGTFSSTRGSYGALAATDWGRGFLAEALAEYDLVLGFDHPTLSVDPVANAAAMLDALSALSLPAPPVIDAVAFSRGGLVFRAFAESLLPGSGWPARVERAVFVGCTHGGTALAAADNWHTLLDLYTNIAAAGARCLGLLGAQVAATILGEAVKTVSGLARAIVVRAIEEEQVPGLAAMAPDSPFVCHLNTASLPAGQSCAYFTVAADFDPDPAQPAPGLGERLMLLLADGVIDRLMGEANDLVVDTEAMTALGTRTAWLRDRLDFATTSAIYHTVYFPQPDVVAALAGWLGLPSGAGRSAVASSPTVITAEVLLEEALRRTDRLPPEAPVVIARSGDGGARFFYPRRKVELALASRSFGRSASLLQSLDLQETHAAQTEREGQPGGPAGRAGRVGRHGKVVLRGDDVVAASAPPLSGAVLELLVGPGRQQQGQQQGAFSPEPLFDSGPAESRPRRGGARGSDTAPSPAAPAWSDPFEEAAAPAPRPSTVPCHVHAEMAEQPAIERPARLAVTVSRAALERPRGPTSVQGSTEVREDRELLIEVVPRGNCRVLGSTRETLEVPAADEPVELVFDIQGEAPGEAELWVEARQGARKLLTLVLQPVFVARESTIRASAVGSAADPELSLVELSIYEDDDLRPRLLFVLRSDDLEISLHDHSDRLRDETKAAYVEAIYRKLERYVGQGAVQYEDFMAELRELGSLMYDELVPLTIRERLWEVRDRIGSIRVMSQEPAIPWELAHIKEPGRPLPPGGVAFLAEKGLVRWLHNLQLPPVRLSYAPVACRYLVPEYAVASQRLPGAAAEREAMRECFAGASEVTASKAELRRLLAEPGSFDLLHIACHGVAEGKHIWESGLILQVREEAGRLVDERLSLPTVLMSANLRHADGTRPIVFLNACQLGRQGRTITATGGLAEAFLRQGAGLVVATLWSIADEEALTFARTFYAELTAGRTLIQATMAARAAAAAQHEPTWLAYTVYGHPYAKLERRPQAAES